jgi:murein DD-endopeptidase MepM/ murein hydrolase activator NlpD
MTRVANAQLRALSKLEGAVSNAHGTLRNVISEVGLDPDRLAAASGRASGQGGPFVPASTDPRMGAFEASIARIQPRIAQIERLRGAVGALPLRRPMSADVEQSSPFGHRLDPFTRGLAMHTGIDFRAEHGMPVRTAGAGRVVSAEYTGGYGNMVEIDHGNGVTTRYAHLSHMSVTEGQSVNAGAIIGRVGSTGRSTGPHLHYETRIGGEAVDPQRFMRAGARFLGAAHAP